jgi:hypothetical protein
MENAIGQGNDTSRCAEALASRGFWIRLVAVLMAINAFWMAITIVGLLVAWLPAWMAYLLWKTADDVQAAARDGNAEALRQGLGRLGTYFTIMGVLIVIGLLFGFLAVGAGFMGAMMGMM